MYLAGISLLVCLASPPARAQESDTPGHSPYASEPDDKLPVRPANFRKRSTGVPAPLSEAPCPELQPNVPPTPAVPPQPVEPTPSFGEMAFGAGVGSNVALSPGGYIDDAVIKTNFRVRWEYGFDMNRPDRAEFFYAAWRELSFHQHAILNQPGGVFQAAQDRGMNPLVTKLNYQQTSAYLELAGGPRASITAEIPWRMLAILDRGREGNGDADQIPPGLEQEHEALETFQDNAGGLGDIVLGFKLAPIARPDRYLTFQFRLFFPSGDARNGLGTGHYSAEAGLLYYGRPTERLSLIGQFKAWVPIDGTRDVNGESFAGNVLTYGLGLGYDLIQNPNFRLTPVAEFVGWTVLNGFETVFGPGLFNQPGLPTNHGVEAVGGTTIINAKLGMRAYFGQRDDVYVGFGQALTTARWYDQIIRVEYRRSW
jgi:hypothetical protein